MNGRAWNSIKRRIPHSIRRRVRDWRAILKGLPAHDQMTRARKALLLSHSRISGFDLVLVPGQPHRSADALTASFYDHQHEDAQYRQNNWLLDQVDVLKSMEPRVVVEVGCGNGRFLRAMAPYASKVIGIDWAQSPELVDLPDNVAFVRSDVVRSAIPSGDIICSADVLEHFAPRDVDVVISRFTGAGPYQHHVIACYDDGHTHLSILPPVAWLALFRKYCPTAYLADVHYRRDDPAQIVCLVSNLPSG